MHSFSNYYDSGAAAMPSYPGFGDVLGKVKAHRAMRFMLDGTSAHESLQPHEKHEHGVRCACWDHLKRTNPHEYDRQAKEHGKRNGENLLHLLRTHDPLYERTWDMLQHMFEVLPDSAEYLIKKGSHCDPAMFLELYEEMRELAQEVEHRGHICKHVAAKQTRQNDRAHGAPDNDIERARMALVDKIKSGRAEEGDLVRYMELSDAAGHEGGR